MKIAPDWKEYSVIATGDGEKLERWGDLILLRPDPQVIWHAKEPLRSRKNISAIYERSSTGGGAWKWLKPINTDFAFLYLTSSLVMFDNRKKIASGNYSIDDVANDGLVNIGSAKHPENQPFKDYDPDNMEPGIWQVLPEFEGDHGTAIGLFADKEKTHKLYLDMMDMLCKVEALREKQAVEAGAER